MLEFQKWKLPKVGRGKYAYWELGTYRQHHDSSDLQQTRGQNKDEGGDHHLLVALQPNRNPGTNGIKLAFYRVNNAKSDDTDSPMKSTGTAISNSVEKLGYLLMINSQETRSSQFLGQFVDEECRGQGLAKIWLGIWLKLCLDAGLRPITGKIRKPLLCLVLEHTFGMVPQPGGVEVELSPGDTEGQVVLYSAGQDLAGAVSPLDLRHQNIRLSTSPTQPRGRPISLGCDFEPPSNMADLEKVVATVLGDRFSLNECALKDDLGEIMLGGGQ